VKKPRKKTKGSGVRPSAGRSSPVQPSAKTTVSVQQRLRLISRWLLGTAIATIGFVGSIVGIWGPVWPTDPSFLPGLPSSGSPLDVPFTVTNKSALFRADQLEISCGLHAIKTRGGSSFVGFSIGASGSNALQAGESRPYTCPFSQVFQLRDDQISEAKIEFWGRYASVVPRRDGQTFSSGVFTLNSHTVPPQWTMGEPLK
jgi:hypothetical protein